MSYNRFQWWRTLPRHKKKDHRSHPTARIENGAEVSVEEILKPVRDEDRGDELWKVFNVIQEKVTRGGFKYKASTGRNKTARSIKNFTRDIELNEQLYELAESYVA